MNLLKCTHATISNNQKLIIYSNRIIYKQYKLTVTSQLQFNSLSNMGLHSRATYAKSNNEAVP